MQEHIYLLTLILPLATFLAIFGMRYASAVLQARAKLAQDDAFRHMAEKAVSVQAQSVQALATIEQTLSDVQARLASIEKVLKDVE